MNRRQSDYDHARKAVIDEKAALAQAKAHLGNAAEAQKLLQGVAEAVQQQAHRQIASVVTRCLEAVFGEDAYEFVIKFRQARNKTEAELLFQREGLVVDPTSAAGGGVVDVAAFALRLACLLLARPTKRRFLCLDEPWKHLSADYRPLMRELVEKLSEELQVQFLLVTHSDEFRIGKIIEL